MSLKTGFSWVDTDEEVAKLYAQKTGEKKTPREIFHEREKEFRILEEEAIASLVGVKDTIISLGGGSTLSPKSQALLPQIGMLVCLFLDKKNLLERWKKISFNLREDSLES